MKEEIEFIELSELLDRQSVLADTVSIEEFINQQIVITQIDFITGQYGEMAIIYTDKGKIRTSGRVILKQLHQIAEKMAEKKVKGVRALVRLRKTKNGRYFILE